MDFEPHNFPALVASVIRADPALAEPLKDVFAAYARNEAFEERLALIDAKFHQPLRLILDDLNEIDDPTSLDQEIQVLQQAIEIALHQVAVELPVQASGRKKKAKPSKKAASKGKKKKAARTPAKKPAGKAKKKSKVKKSSKPVKKASKKSAAKAKPKAKAKAKAKAKPAARSKAKPQAKKKAAVKKKAPAKKKAKAKKKK